MVPNPKISLARFSRTEKSLRKIISSGNQNITISDDLGGVYGVLGSTKNELEY
ncbi:hypothetical protein NC653_027146 [Populus alba x Populus x berolinensis]|uniref:Uncharacterized protein n=1 Tax=Populus alba x Populus x berolinensis TaxID=444605 RepID=A0AAD6Q6G2_9ROSI|nr:hypothetical protein NC653_027146 [Populus alba x Populus x berolinensis]